MGLIFSVVTLSLHAQQEAPIRVFDSYQGQKGTWMAYQNLDRLRGICN